MGQWRIKFGVKLNFVRIKFCVNYNHHTQMCIVTCELICCSLWPTASVLQTAKCSTDRERKLFVIVQIIMGSTSLLMWSAVLVLAVLQVAQCQCQDYKSEDTTTCSMLFWRFQSALVGNELNLYNLRKTFAPASHPAPILVNVSYEISFGHVPDSLCPGADNDSTLLNTSKIQYLSYGWTSAVLYKYFHPAELNQMQPQIVLLFVRNVEQSDSEEHSHVATALTWDGTGPITTAQLSLYIPSLPCSPTYKETYNTLWDVTSLVSVTKDVVSIILNKL